MQDIPILRELVLLLAVSLGATYLLKKLRVPTIVGFLVAGILIGPGGLGLVHDPHTVQVMAEIGVVLLLFVIGLKFSLREIVQMKTLVLAGGGLQVGLTVSLSAGFAFLWGFRAVEAIFLGFLVSLSSTAIVLKLLEERGEMDSPQGRLGVGILLFQDLSVIPMMLLVPVLGAAGAVSPETLLLSLLKPFAVLGFFLAAAGFVFPWFLERIVRTRSRELFMMAVALAALGTAYLAGLVGIPLSLGAFLAGMVISESDYAHQIVSEISPFYDLFSSVFFVSIGMLVDMAFLREEPVVVFGLAGGILLLKITVVFLAALSLRMGFRVAILTGFAVGQIGEFAFVLTQAGAAHGLLDAGVRQPLLSASVLTMALTPFLLMLGHVVARRFTGHGAGPVAAATRRASDDLKDHVLIVGYGINGRNIVHILQDIGAPHLILELNPLTVRRLRKEGQQVMFGDAVRRPILLRAGIERARVLVATVSDPAASRQIVAQAKELNPGITVLVRTRYASEIAPLHRLGSDHAVADEFEASLELAGRLMILYGMDKEAIENRKELIRQENYRLLIEEVDRKS
jgi:CPA2 family monovalent cation:H+ antiporter-2